MSNLTILQQNICNSLWDCDEDVTNEAQRIFLEYCEKDNPPLHAAENMARAWLRVRKLLCLAESTGMYENAPWDEIKDFFLARMPNAWATRTPNQSLTAGNGLL